MNDWVPTDQRNGVAVAYRKSARRSLKGHPEFNKKWLQQQIASDFPLLGLGELDVMDIERRRPGFGHRDMLFPEARAIIAVSADGSDVES
jgi:hypothetical protein